VIHKALQVLGFFRVKHAITLKSSLPSQLITTTSRYMICWEY
jgi:hypothetical protein